MNHSGETRILFSMALLCLMLSACVKDTLTKKFTILEPVYASKSEVVAAIGASEPREVNSTGKIYWYGNYIFMNDPGRGIHIYDNTNPASPQKKAFINLPGNIDIAVKGNILYADLFTDMVVIDISDPLEPVHKKLVADVFPERKYVSGYLTDPDKIIVGWSQKDTVVDINDPIISVPGWGCPNCMVALADGGFKSGTEGAGGSMARFAVVNDFLYSVSVSNLSAFNIQTPADPTLVHSNPFGWNIETVYPFRQKLFIGSSTGMFIADISEPAVPVIQGSFQHATACDPVVANDEHAFVTLRTGNRCVGNINQLDILDIRDVQNPVLLKTYPMTNPAGLGIKGSRLYLCDGDDGLKVFDITDPMQLNMIQRIPMSDTYDVIINQNLLLLVSGSGLHQYRIVEEGKLTHLSTIKTN